MIMYMYERLLAVTSRKLCNGPFLDQIDWLAGRHPTAILLREKDLSEREYEMLAVQVMKRCDKHHTPCILHSWPDTARRIGCDSIHLPLPILREFQEGLGDFKKVGTSVHSVEDALEASRLGATYLIAGHVFPTDCKRDVPPRGLAFLKEVCSRVTLPVFGIGGITAQNASEVLDQGAYGWCSMSKIMKNRYD